MSAVSNEANGNTGSLQSKVVLVTGGASGLGAAVVAAVAKAGGQPLVIDRSPPQEHVAAHVADREEADLADSQEAERATAALIERAGRVDAVVTAAGIDRPGQLSEVPRDEWEHVLRTNLLGTVSVIRAALPHLEATRGRVVAVSSTLGVRAVSDATAYCASKFGVVGFVRALAAELAGRIGVTLLVPGGMRTHFFDNRDEKYKPGDTSMLNAPEDVAETVLFALNQPQGCEVRELVVCHEQEGSWP